MMLPPTSLNDTTGCCWKAEPGIGVGGDKGVGGGMVATRRYAVRRFQDAAFLHMP